MVQRAEDDEEKTSRVASVKESETLAWDDPRQTKNPVNWSIPKKIFHTVVPCFAAFEATFATSVMVPATPMLMQHFSVSRTQAILSLTLYTMGIAFGPLFIAPLSEVFGRKLVYVASLTMLLAFTGGAGAAQSFGGLLACRLLAGILGTSTVAVGAGTIADVWSLTKAGASASLFFILGPFLGPTLGPLAGAYILYDRNDDWRWTMWLVLMVGAPIWIGSVLMNETSRLILMQRHGYSQQQPDALTKGLVAAALNKVKIGVKRPTRMLCKEPIVISLALYTGFAYATIFSYFGSASYVLQKYYGFDTRQVGLSFISVIIGYLLAAMMFGVFDRTLFAKAAAASENGHAEPEHRLYAGLVGSIFLPISLFWYAWEVHRTGNWAALVAAGIPFGLGSFSIFLSSITYMVDVYKAQAAASAIAANGVLRYLLGAVLPLFTIQMYEALGPHWAGSIFAFIAVLLMPIPWLLFKFGRRLR